MWIAETWSEIDKRIFALCLPTQWDIRGAEGLSRDTSYLVISNHQSWVDIPALMQGLNRRTPFFKFFLKKELIWVPFLGLAWWALDYPFMKRYSKAFLAKHPAAQRRRPEDHPGRLRAVQAPAGHYRQLPRRHALYPGQTRAATVALYLAAQAQGRRRGVCAGGNG
jgi:1-acyl-sn-glycerol-3-phosphate acyltransferase